MRTFYKIVEEQPQGCRLILVSKEAQLNEYLSSLVVHCSIRNFIFTSEMTKRLKIFSVRVRSRRSQRKPLHSSLEFVIEKHLKSHPYQQRNVIANTGASGDQFQSKPIIPCNTPQYVLMDKRELMGFPTRPGRRQG